MTVNMKIPFLYRKPQEICRELSVEDNYHLSLTKHEFISYSMRVIENEMKSKGLSLRVASFDDIRPVERFIAKRYRSDLATEVSAYDLFRFIEFGHGLVIEDNEKTLLGCLFEVGLDTIERTSYSVRLGIDESLNGKNIGQLLTRYSALMAMRRGSKVKRGIIDFDNCANLYIQLNHVGWIVESFYYQIPELGDCYNVVLPLTIEGLTCNKIDTEKTIEFVKNSKEGTDYRKIKFDDLDYVLKTYQETDFKIVAMLKAGLIGETHYLIALPAKTIGLEI